MKQHIINLDPNFTPYGGGAPVKLIDFPSGFEPHINVMASQGEPVWITCRIKSANDIFRLLLCVDALHRKGIHSIYLFIPYLPFARQDRVMNEGEPLSLKVMADLLNSCEFQKVWIFDPHSEVSLALINNSEAINNHKFVRMALSTYNDYLIVCPDAGAYKKIFKLCQSLQYTDEIIMCNKIRDVTTGAIKQVTVSHDDFKGRDLFIVDDICDGGGTFIELSKKLKELHCGSINLIVSHGIFSKGFAELAQRLDNIYVTDSFQWMETSATLGFLHKFQLQTIFQS